MFRLFGRCAAVILLAYLSVGVSVGARAQSDSGTEQAVPPGMRPAKIQEANLSDDPSPKPDRKAAEKRGSKSRQRGADDEQPAVQESAIPPAQRGTGALPPLARITEKTAPQRAASLKLVEEGREFLAAGEYKEALGAFERSIAVDATNPYSHYFVARAHLFLGNYQVSANFLDVAESLLGWHKLWLSEIYVLKGRNAMAMGFWGRADTNYLNALRFDPYNRFAFEKLANIQPITERAELPVP